MVVEKARFCWRMKAAKPLGIAANLTILPLDFRVEARPQFYVNGGIIRDGIKIFPHRFGMKDGAFHCPMICRACANTSSAGTP